MTSTVGNGPSLSGVTMKPETVSLPLLKVTVSSRARAGAAARAPMTMKAMDSRRGGEGMPCTREPPVGNASSLAGNGPEEPLRGRAVEEHQVQPDHTVL